MYVKPYERALMDIAAYRLHKQLYVYVSPIIVVVGVVGNLLSFIVLVQRPLRRVSTYCYLIVLAVADTVVLTAGLLPRWIEQVRAVVSLLRSRSHKARSTLATMSKQHCRSNSACCFDNVAVLGNNVEATFYIVAFDNVASTLLKQLSTLSKQHSTLLPQTATMSNDSIVKFRFFQQCRMLLRHCCRFWQQCCRFRQQCRTKFRPFDKVETN